MNITTSIPITGNQLNVNNVWARLEQEYKKDVVSDGTGISDLLNMIGRARVGSSAFTYVKDVCKYAKLEGTDTVVVTLDIFVWPSSMSLEYDIKVDLGTISSTQVMVEDRSFDVVFEGTNKVDLPYIFDGKFTPQMPFISPTGVRLLNINVVPYKTYVTTDKDVFCVLRANGTVSGYRHTVTMALDKSGEDDKEYKIENLQNTVVITWLDENGEEQSDSLQLEIPPCVEGMLDTCDNGLLVGVIGCLGRDCDGKDMYVVYYNSCDGEPILERWEKNE